MTTDSNITLTRDRVHVDTRAVVDRAGGVRSPDHRDLRVVATLVVTRAWSTSTTDYRSLRRGNRILLGPPDLRLRYRRRLRCVPARRASCPPSRPGVGPLRQPSRPDYRACRQRGRSVRPGHRARVGRAIVPAPTRLRPQDSLGGLDLSPGEDRRWVAALPLRGRVEG